MFLVLSMLLLERRWRTGFGSKSETWNHDKRVEASRTLSYAWQNASSNKMWKERAKTMHNLVMEKVEGRFVAIAHPLGSMSRGMARGSK